MKAKIKKGLVFKSADGAVITVITMNIKSQVVTYSQVQGDVTSQQSISKKLFEEMLSKGVNPAVVETEKEQFVVPAVADKANDDQLVREALAAKYVPNPQRVNLDFNNMNAVFGGEIKQKSHTLLGGKERFKMLDESKWLIKEVTATYFVNENTETLSLQTFTKEEFVNLIDQGHLVLL